jgi:hypothetical protein
MWILVFALSIALAAARPLAAQFPPDVAVGTRVRVVLPDSLRQAWAPREQWLRGEVAAVAADTLYLRLQGTESPIAIRRAAIKRLDRSLGVPGRAESALRGAIAGAFWTAAYLAAARHLADGTRPWPGPGDDLAEGAAIGVGIGVVLGAIFPTERWRRVRLR